ncbi:effector-associated constant component EACC1 [Herbidospora sp. RD11066]
MTILLTITAQDTADGARDLYAWLREEPELRGLVRVVDGEIRPGALGAGTDGLQVLLGAGGGLATLATVVIAWLRTRRGEVSVSLTTGPEETRVEVTAKGVKSLDVDATRALTGQIAEVLREAALHGDRGDHGGG